MVDESELRAVLAYAVQQLDGHLEILGARLCAEADYPTWLWKQSDAHAGRRYASQVIQAIDYQDGQDAHHCRAAPGLLGGAPETLAAARAVNHWKQRVRAALAPMVKRTIVVHDPETGKPLKRPLDKVALAALKHPRFHKRQALRQLVVIDHPVSRATFFWAKLPKIQTIDKVEAIKRLSERLERSDSPELRLEWERLQLIGARERLAVVNEPHIHPKVNLVLHTVDGIKRIPKRGVLPVLYPDQPGAAGPDIRALPDEPPPAGHRLKRSDVQIEAEPYLPSLRIHRYLPPYRILSEERG
jgi:hypothetical protein